MDVELFSEQVQFSITYDYFLGLNAKYRKQRKAKGAIENLHSYFLLKKIMLDEAGYKNVSNVLSEAFPDFVDNNFPQVSIPFVFVDSR